MLPLRGGGREAPKAVLNLRRQWNESVPSPDPHTLLPPPISILRKCSRPHGTTPASDALCLPDGTWRSGMLQGSLSPRATEISNPYVTLFF